MSILIAGGYGEVGRRLAGLLDSAAPGRVIVAGRHPERVRERPARALDVDDPESIEQALDGVTVLVACVRQSQPHLLQAAVRRGIAYTSIAPPWIPWSETTPLRAEAERTGARILLAAGLEPGITSVLARSAAERLGRVDSVETALLLSLGDAYGVDSMAFIAEEVSQRYSILVNGRAHLTYAFERPTVVDFPQPIGRRRAFTMPFRDQLYYPATLGAKTAIARIALDPPWLAEVMSVLLRTGLRKSLGRGGTRSFIHGLAERLRGRYAGRNEYALVVDVRSSGRLVRSSLAGRRQAETTAVGVAAIIEALWLREVDRPGIWLPEQVIAPQPFLARLASHGIVPVTAEVSPGGDQPDLLHRTA